MLTCRSYSEVESITETTGEKRKELKLIDLEAEEETHGMES